jgi:LysR family transcriptional regulator, cys regulon transcriptional activator
MNLRQLRYISEIAQRGLNISAVASALHTSQPGISKQVRLLETELGAEIFVRSSNRLSGVTPLGQKIIGMAQNVIAEISNIRVASRDLEQERSGSFVIATTHTQARYVLPEIMKRFTLRYPKVQLTLRHGDPSRISELLLSGEADIGVTTETAKHLRELLVLPCRRFQRVVIVPRGHELLNKKRLTLKLLAKYPLVTYEPAFTGRRQLEKAFEREGLKPTLVLSAIDADVIKSCVEHGLGIAVLSEVTYDKSGDFKLCALPAGHLFEPSVTNIVIHRHRYQRRYVYDFIEMCAPPWSRANVQRATALRRSR